jgi:hypothetical protein
MPDTAGSDISDQLVSGFLVNLGQLDQAPIVGINGGAKGLQGDGEGAMPLLGVLAGHHLEHLLVAKVAVEMTAGPRARPGRGGIRLALR